MTVIPNDFLGEKDLRICMHPSTPTYKHTYTYDTPMKTYLRRIIGYD